MATLTQRTSQDIKARTTQLPVQAARTQAMTSKMWAPFIAMGFMTVMAAFVYGLVNSSISADYFQFYKEARDAAVAGFDLATQKALIESTKAWLPAFKLLGMGMILGGVPFLLATILGALHTGGARHQEALGVPVTIIKAPMTGKSFPC